MKKVLFLNRSYWPDAEATGQLLTELCEDLATPTQGTGCPSLDVTVIAGQPNADPTGSSFRRRGVEVRNGVRIHRVRHTRFAKTRRTGCPNMLGRLANYLSFLIAAFWAALWIRRPDVVVVETDPPLLCLIGWFLQRIRGAKLVCYLQDIHPDIGIALGKLRDGWPLRTLRRLLFHVYRGADRVVVLSRDMRDCLTQSGVPSRQIVCIPNWIDTEKIRPVKHRAGEYGTTGGVGNENLFRRRHGIDGQFLVMYSGNLGLCQRLEDVIAAAHFLRDRPDILFLLVGEGSLQRQLQGRASELGLKNVRFLPYQPKAELAASLSAVDVHLVPLDERIASFLMPSKLYGVLASATPLVAVAPEECELAELTLEHDIGVLAPPGQPEALAEVVERLADHTWDLPAMGKRARRLAESQYDRRLVTARFQALLWAVLGKSREEKREKGRKGEREIRKPESPLLPQPAERVLQPSFLLPFFPTSSDSPEVVQ